MNTETNPFIDPHTWDVVSLGYQEMAELFLQPFSKKAIEMTGPKASDQVLDLACGTGTLSTLLASQVSSIQALDFSEEMVQKLKLRTKNENIKNVTVTQGDGQSLPFQDQSFDLAYSLFGLMFFPDPLKGLKEMKRTLKPGGSALFSSWDKIETSTLMQAVGSALQHAMPEHVPSKRATRGVFEDPNEMVKAMEKAGFTDIQVENYCMEYPHLSAAEFWGIFERGVTFTALLRHRLPDDEWKRGSEKAIAYLEELLGKGDKRLHTTAHLAVGRVAS